MNELPTMNQRLLEIKNTARKREGFRCQLMWSLTSGRF